MDRHGRPLQYTLSEKDRRAPDLAEVHAAGLLPTVDACQVTLAARWSRPRAMPRVTVICPAYNRGPAIERTIRSVIRQSMPDGR